MLPGPTSDEYTKVLAFAYQRLMFYSANNGWDFQQDRKFSPNSPTDIFPYIYNGVLLCKLIGDISPFGSFFTNPQSIVEVKQNHTLAYTAFQEVFNEPAFVPDVDSLLQRNSTDIFRLGLLINYLFDELGDDFEGTTGIDFDHWRHMISTELDHESSFTHDSISDVSQTRSSIVESEESGAPASEESGAPASEESGAPASEESGAPASEESGAPASEESGAPASEQNRGGIVSLEEDLHIPSFIGCINEVTLDSLKKITKSQELVENVRKFLVAKTALASADSELARLEEEERKLLFLIDKTERDIQQEKAAAEDARARTEAYAKLQADLAILRKKNGKLEKRIESYTAQLGQLQRQKEKLSESSAETTSARTIQTLQETIQSLTREANALQELQDEKAQLKHDVSVTNQRVVTLDARDAALAARLAKYQAAKEEAEQHALRYQKDLALLTKKIERAKDRNQQFRSAIEQVAAAGTAAPDLRRFLKLIELEQQVHEAEKKKARAPAAASAAASRERVQSLLQLLETERMRAANQKQLLDDLSAKERELEAEAGRTREQRRAEAEQEVQQLKATLVEYQQKLQNMQEKHELRVRQKKEEIRKAVRTRNHLRKQKKRRDAQASSRTSTSHRLGEVSRKIEEEKAHCESLSSSITKLKETCAQESAEAEEARSTIETLHRQLSRNAERIKAAREKSQGLTVQRRKLATQLTRMQLKEREASRRSLARSFSSLDPQEQTRKATQMARELQELVSQKEDEIQALKAETERFRLDLQRMSQTPSTFQAPASLSDVQERLRRAKERGSTLGRTNSELEAQIREVRQKLRDLETQNHKRLEQFSDTAEASGLGAAQGVSAAEVLHSLESMKQNLMRLREKPPPAPWDE